jgi:hypothetical protein
MLLNPSRKSSSAAARLRVPWWQCRAIAASFFRPKRYFCPSASSFLAFARGPLGRRGPVHPEGINSSSVGTHGCGEKVEAPGLLLRR